MYQSGRVGDEAGKRKSPTKSGRVGISVIRNVRAFFPRKYTHARLALYTSNNVPFVGAILFFRMPACCIVLPYGSSFRQPDKVTWFLCVFMFNFLIVSVSFDYG